MSEETRASPLDQARGLAEGILGDARTEAAKLLAEAEAFRSGKEGAAEDEARAILAEAEAAATAAEAELRRNAESRLALERRKAELGATERFIRRVEAEARALFQNLATDPAEAPRYRELLRDWIAEAALGLGADSAQVRASAADRALLDGALLREAEARVLGLGGSPIRLALAEEAAPGDRGVELVAEGGRLIYDNRAGTRFARAAAGIRALALEPGRN